MKKDIRQGTEEFEVFGEIFSLYKEIGTPEDNDDYWKDVIDRINSFVEKHDNSLGRELALAIMSVLNGETTEQRYSRLIALVTIKAYEDKAIAKEFAREAVKVANKWIREDEHG